MRKLPALLGFLLLAGFASEAHSQAANCRVSTSAPTYANGTTAPLSCETDGDLRVNATASGGSGGEVNITAVGGNAVTTTVPVSDGGSSLSIDDAAGSLTVDNGGTFAVQAAQSGTWDEVGIHDSGNSITVDGTVTVQDGGGTLSIDDAAGSITVDGTVTVTDGSGSLNVIVDSGSVAVSSITAGDNNIGNVDLASALPAGTNNIGDVDIASSNSASTQAAALPTAATAVGYKTDQGLAAGTAGNTTPIICQDSVAISTASSGNTQLVALTASETVHVCGYNFIADGDVDVQLITGTGTACATGETDLTGAYPLAAQAGIVVQSPHPITKGIASNALCIELSGAVQVSGMLNYTKF